MGAFRLDDYIGSPLPSSQTSSFYSDLKHLRKDYFKRVPRSFNYWDYIKTIQYIDHTLFKLIEQWVPMKANFFKMKASEYQFYSKIATGYHPTDPHNFYIRIISEYGIFGLIFLMTFLYTIVISISNASKVRNINYIGYCGMFSIMGYGFFQTFPISYPMIILFLTMITFNNNSIE